jgi:hypothetical protein
MFMEKVCTKLKSRNRSIVPSYKALRALIGIMGMALPFILILLGWLFGGYTEQESISIYYYSNMGTFLTGILFAVGFFLVTYHGYLLIDTIVTSVTGFAGMGVACFPCFNELYKGQKVGIFQLVIETSDIVHLSCAATFFILLALNSLFLFTRTDGKGDRARKDKRNVIYVVCGIVILAALLVLLVCIKTLPHEVLAQYHIVISLETVCLLAFGVSWLTKGEAIFPDRKGHRQ